MDLLGELGILLIITILAILIIPILIGIGIAILLDATGLTYYTIVILTSLVVWGTIGTYLYI